MLDLDKTVVARFPRLENALRNNWSDLEIAVIQHLVEVDNDDDVASIREWDSIPTRRDLKALPDIDDLATPDNHATRTDLRCIDEATT